MGQGLWDLIFYVGLGMWDLVCETWYVRLDMWDLEYETWTVRLGICGTWYVGRTKAPHQEEGTGNWRLLLIVVVINFNL